MKKSKTCVLAFLLVMWMSVPVFAMGQHQKVTLRVTDAGIQSVLQEIKRQTNLNFVYSPEQIDALPRVNLNVRGESVNNVLQGIFKDSGLEYLFESESIIIRKSQAPQVPESKEIKGKIVDEKGNPLPGVTVMIKGTGMGVVTDAEGKYSLQLPEAEGIRLLFTFIGMKPQEVAYAGQKEVNVTMHEEATQIDEVVITGYQTVDRRKSTSSVTTVKMEDLNIPGVSSIDQMLQGRVPDLIMMNNSGEVGVVPKLRIRGTSTLIGNREPLWVLDGIVMQDPVDIPASDLNDPDYINRIGNAIAGINPQDIERIDVLKDAAATALYGTRAANGVIVVTTKKGRVGRPIVTYNMSTTLRQRPSYNDRAINVMNSKERVQFLPRTGSAALSVSLRYFHDWIRRTIEQAI